ncbi:MAG: hypothetical protein J2P41_02640 [Blastocatellia bacterium]|nr:hypothetical protein [Blastocatellia bacterium]
MSDVQELKRSIEAMIAADRKQAAERAAERQARAALADANLRDAMQSIIEQCRKDSQERAAMDVALAAERKAQCEQARLSQLAFIESLRRKP